MAVAIGILFMFLYCYFGRMATESFMDMTDCLFESNWLNLSVDLQKFFILMIGNARRPMFYNGSRIATVNLETFTAVSLYPLIYLIIVFKLQGDT